MRTFPDAPQDTLFDLPPMVTESTPALGPEGDSCGAPSANRYSTALTYLGQLRSGQMRLPNSSHLHTVGPDGAIRPDPTVWDTPNLTRVAASATTQFTRDQVDALLLAWAILHKIPPQQPLGAFVHAAAIRECSAYLEPLLNGHTTLCLWFQHAEALYAITKHADAAVVSAFVPRRPPAGQTPTQAGRANAAKHGGWRPFLTGLHSVRNNLKSVGFVMGTGRRLTVGVSSNVSA